MNARLPSTAASALADSSAVAAAVGSAFSVNTRRAYAAGFGAWQSFTATRGWAPMPPARSHPADPGRPCHPCPPCRPHRPVTTGTEVRAYLSVSSQPFASPWLARHDQSAPVRFDSAERPRDASRADFESLSGLDSTLAGQPTLAADDQPGQREAREDDQAPRPPPARPRLGPVRVPRPLHVLAEAVDYPGDVEQRLRLRLVRFDSRFQPSLHLPRPFGHLLAGHATPRRRSRRMAAAASIAMAADAIPASRTSRAVSNSSSIHRCFYAS